MHVTLEEQGDWLRQAVMGFFAYPDFRNSSPVSQILPAG